MKGISRDKDGEVVWNTMKASRVSGLGFAEVSSTLDTVKTDADGNIFYDFWGIQHRIGFA